MKEIYIADITTSQEVTDFFMVKSIAVKIGANKKQYLDLMLGDKTGEISGKKWDVSDDELPSLMEIKEGDVIKIRANVTEWNGLKQFRVMRIRKTSSGDQIEISDYIKAAPEKPQDMYDYITVEKNRDLCYNK